MPDPASDRPGAVTLFRRGRGKPRSHPDVSGFAVAHRDIRAGERVRLVLFATTPAGSVLAGQMLDERVG